MPYEIDWQPMGVIYRFSGVVSDEDLRAATAEVYASPLLLTMKYLIADFSLIEEFAVSSATVRMVADSDSRVSKTNPDVKVAIISTAVFMRGMSNIYAITHSFMRVAGLRRSLSARRTRVLGWNRPANSQSRTGEDRRSWARLHSFTFEVQRALGGMESLHGTIRRRALPPQS